VVMIDTHEVITVYDLRLCFEIPRSGVETSKNSYTLSTVS
jgi:hypothetical protein